MKIKSLSLALSVSIVGMLSGCSTMDMGSTAAKTEATGSAGGANSEGANKALAHCDAPLGTIAVVEDTNAPWYGILSGQYHLGSTTPVLKLMIQQSNCFVVVDRGRAMGNMMQERQLAQSGELRGNSNFGKGQMVSADFSLAPSITFSNNNAGSVGSLVGGMLGSVGAIVGGSLSAKEASTLLTLDDNRSGVQLAAAEGSAKNWDIGAIGGLFGGGAGGIGGGYSNTAEGKVIVAALMDSYNGVVKAVQNYKAQNVQGGLGTGGHLAVQGASAAQFMQPRQGMSLEQAQAKLNTLGFPVGRPDGVMGPKTRIELKRFQKSRGIPESGDLDPVTISQLSN
jgi:curli biogenesis system outer membrane secretion channel CsgG